jgi:tetratricopeptide (TPR) repeat protein
MHAYGTKDLERLFGLPASAVRALARAGNIHPVRRSGRLHYSFHDLVVLRTASALLAAKISSRRINRTLQELRSALPSGSALNKLSLTALGNRIAIREAGTLREPDSGQYALALEIVEEKGRLHLINRTGSAVPAASSGAAKESADELYTRAIALEDTDEQQAREVYAACLNADPNYVEARINLGRLLHLAGRLPEAQHVYRTAPQPDPLLAFNHAVLLEDLGRESDAIGAYRAALALDPEFADAHFNLARLYERAQDTKSSLRHLLAYRRVTHDQGA